MRFFLISLLIVFTSCSMNKNKVYICGDRECIDKKEIDEYFEKNISLEVFNIQGKRISILDKQYKTAGIYNIEWDASSFSSGIYILRLKSDINPLTTSKITLMK